MKYNLENLIKDFNSKKKLKFLFFWGHTQNGDEITKACFSQWYSCKFVVDEITYHTAEQYMMAQKALLFNDNEIFYKIMSSKSPKEYKELGRKIKNFSDSKWNENKYQIVLKGNIAKFLQNEIGSIEVGKKADIAVFDAPNMSYFLYHFGVNHTDSVYKNGKLVFKR